MYKKSDELLTNNDLEVDKKLMLVPILVHIWGQITDLVQIRHQAHTH